MREFQKNIHFHFIEYAKTFDYVDNNKLWKILEEISSLSHSIVFLYFFALIPEEGFLPLLAILWNSAFRWVHLSVSPLPLTNFLSYFFVLLRKPFCLYIFGGLS